MNGDGRRAKELSKAGRQHDAEMRRAHMEAAEVSALSAFLFVF